MSKTGSSDISMFVSCRVWVIVHGMKRVSLIKSYKFNPSVSDMASGGAGSVVYYASSHHYFRQRWSRGVYLGNLLL